MKYNIKFKGLDESSVTELRKTIRESMLLEGYTELTYEEVDFVRYENNMAFKKGVTTLYVGISNDVECTIYKLSRTKFKTITNKELRFFDGLDFEVDTLQVPHQNITDWYGK
jgi:hypothetical protein